MNFIYEFCRRCNITTRMWTGNKSLSPNQVVPKNKYLSYQLGLLKRSYDNDLDGSTIENFDETHVVADIGNGRVLDFQGSNRVTNLDVASGRNCFTVCMRISGGQSARIEKPRGIFQNLNRKYSISGILNNVDGISNHSSPNGWMTAQIFVNYFSDPCIIQPLDNNSKRNIWIDSCWVHNESPDLAEALQLSSTELKRFQQSFTSTAQPLDKWVLRTFKAERRKRWETSETNWFMQANLLQQGELVILRSTSFSKLLKKFLMN